MKISPPVEERLSAIQWDANGNAMAILAPGGQQTVLTLEGNGYLASLTNPNNEKIELTYSKGVRKGRKKRGQGASARSRRRVANERVVQGKT